MLLNASTMNHYVVYLQKRYVMVVNWYVLASAKTVLLDVPLNLMPVMDMDTAQTVMLNAIVTTVTVSGMIKRATGRDSLVINVMIIILEKIVQEEKMLYGENGTLSFWILMLILFDLI